MSLVFAVVIQIQMSDSQREFESRPVQWFARRHKVTAQAVTKAIANGRLPASCLVYVNGTAQIADVTAADKAWVENADYSKASPEALARLAAESDSEDLHNLADASRLEKHWKSKIAELKFKEAARELVPARDVEARLIAVFSEVRTKLLGIPSRIRQQIPTLGAAEMTLIDDLVREALTGLARE